jgi:hypothetical protein
VCVLVKFKHDQERNTYSWLYTGGCYKGNDPVNYEDARPGETRDFKDVQFEVRIDHRSFEQITLLPVSEDDEDDGANPNNSMTPDGTPPKKESDAERKIRLKKEELENVSEAQPSNFFYKFFMFVSILCVFLSIISVCLLIFNVLQMAKEPTEEE